MYVWSQRNFVVLKKYDHVNLIYLARRFILFLGKRHNRVHPGQNATHQGTYLFTAWTYTADWSTPTFTLPCPKNGGVYPATSTFLQNCTPIFRNVPWPGGKWDPSIGYFLRTNHFPLPAKDTKTQIFLPGNRHTPTKEHQNINYSSISEHTIMAYHHN